ncbi:MAG: DUF29 domain-containing protein [Moorea sp. SIO2I5]|nr:DUF29 domain-containing protein [Moorena sp. SIO2I5]
MEKAYTKDFHSWTQQTAQLLREGRWQEIDLDNLIEEVEDLGKSERRGITKIMGLKPLPSRAAFIFRRVL